MSEKKQISENSKQQLEANNGKLVAKLCFAVLAMFGFGFAMVPLYDVFCEVTGINGRVVVKANSTDVDPIDESRIVTVEFITRIANGNDMSFQALTQKVQLHPGQMSEVAFKVKNPSQYKVFAQAIPSVSPGQASLYLNKTECFCFTQQELQGKEEVTYPMKFFLDQDLPESITLLTVSYTLYKVGSEQLASAATEDNQDVESI
ncbi:cytochrome c oxidase assembly protein [Saccharobesus litoralis]|uniref:Cytochrome c oxidase assembly protein CtaG n=1 Tax=Saccharobesus litoralis TaxID=2172099 RepID=A0A2S0VR40_9ALTE|nr:cytochrome c oxidase assembly protein [Saccharobesus litoralis]AWB66688.1 cytochrome c oxidase assembly protein [Saccharobesus litoralis]